MSDTYVYQSQYMPIKNKCLNQRVQDSLLLKNIHCNVDGTNGMEAESDKQD